MVVKIAVGPSAPPIIPNAPASFGVKPINTAQKQYGKDTQLGSRTEYGETQVTEHRTEVRQRTHPHKDDRWQESGLISI